MLSRRLSILIGLVALLPGAALAQVPTPSTPACDSGTPCPRHPMGGMNMGSMGMGNMEAHMKTMQAGDARLDSLVTRMHSATGSAKTGAMERVIDELIAQRKMMQAHMMQMHTQMMQMHQMPGMPGREHRDSLHHDDDDD